MAAPQLLREAPDFWLVLRPSFSFGWPVAMALLVALLASPLAAQTQSLQAWPEIDTYLSLNSDVRVSFLLPPLGRTVRAAVPSSDRTSTSTSSPW